MDAIFESLGKKICEEIGSKGLANDAKGNRAETRTFRYKLHPKEDASGVFSLDT